MAFGFPASSSRTHHLDVDPIIMRQLVRDAFAKLDWSFEIVDRETVVARIPMNMFTYGERVTVSVDDDGKLTAKSKCLWPMQLFDWGKNKQNINELFRCLISSIRNSELNPQERPSAFDEHGISPLERALRDRK